MRLAAQLTPWRLLPSYAINGIVVALGIGGIQLLATFAAGPHAAQLIVSGATCASLADVPNSVTRTWQRVSAAALLSFAAALIVDLLRPHPLALGAGIAAIGFAAMMVMSWGARAGAVAFSPILSTIFAMAVPTTGHPLAVAGWSACGGIAYLAWSIAAGHACQRRYRTLALVNALRGAAGLFRSRAGVLEAHRRRSGGEQPLRAWIHGETALADRLQAARDFVFAATASPKWHRDTAILLRVIDLRDLLLASPLDIELLGNDATAQAILTQVADALREISEQLDRRAGEIGDGVAAESDAPPRVDFAARLADVTIAPDDARVRLVPALVRRQQRMADDVARVHRLVQGAEEALPLTAVQLQRFVSAEGWPLRALRSQWQLDSLVLRHAIRTALALSAAYFIALALPWGSHPYWLVLSVAVVLRGTLGDTLARRNARVLGTVLGCLVVVALSKVPDLDFLRGVYVAALGTAHAFAMQRYWLTATAASVMALLQSNLVNPGSSGFAIAERVADTLLGALLAWCFSYVLPSWERRGARKVIANIFTNLRAYAAFSLRVTASDPVEERLLRRKAYDSLASLGGALQRSGVEPERVRLPVEQIGTLLDHAGRLMAHLSVIRQLLAQIDTRKDAPSMEGILRDAHASLSTYLDLGSAAAPLSDAEVPPGLDLLPANPPADDLMPWLARRLRLMIHDAARMRAAADPGVTRRAAMA
ncbi:MAG: FUSC family membrane protein [Betaproteobacteria bacterium]